MPRPLSVALVIALALTACGKSSAEKYKEAFPAIDRGLVALAADVRDGLRSAGQSDDRRLAAEFGGYARRVGELSERLGDLEAPDGLTKDHDELLAATAAVRGALSDIAAAARGSDAAAARDAGTRLVRGGERLDQARSELERAVRGL